MLSFVYQPSFSGSPHPCPSLSLSTATSIYERRGWLLPTLATRGAGNAPKVTLTDTKHTRSDTITTNMEHARNVILTVSGVLTTSNEGEGTIEVREEKEQQGGEARKEYTSSEALRQSSPTVVHSPVNFGRLAGCVTCNVSTLRSGTRNPWANLNRRHCRSHPCTIIINTHSVHSASPRNLAHKTRYHISSHHVIQEAIHTYYYYQSTPP
jgi:hypothetical protein